MPCPPGVARIAFFITSYRSSSQLDRLVRTLRLGAPDSPVVIHHDRFQTALPPDLFADMDDVHVLTSPTPVVWGDMTLELVRWRVFRWVLEHLDVDWVMLLSEQDYPIAPLHGLEARLAGTTADALIQGQKVDDIEDPGLRRECALRYYYQYRSLPTPGLVINRGPAWWRRLYARRRLLFLVLSRLQRRVAVYACPDALGLPTKMGIRPAVSPFTAEFPCWYSDCWYALSRKALEHLVEYVDAHPQLVEYYQRTIIPLESATATILCNDPDLEVEHAGLHAIRWSDPESGRPDVFGPGDIGFLRASGSLFARKFDERDTGVLDQLDGIVLADAVPSR